MNHEESTTFTVTDQDGNETELEILFTFFSKEFGKDYIVYTDHTLDENGNTNVFASVYKPDSEDTTLYPIEAEAEWALVEKALDQIRDTVEDIDNWEVTAVD